MEGFDDDPVPDVRDRLRENPQPTRKPRSVFGSVAVSRWEYIATPCPLCAERDAHATAKLMLEEAVKAVGTVRAELVKCAEELASQREIVRSNFAAHEEWNAYIMGLVPAKVDEEVKACDKAIKALWEDDASERRNSLEILQFTISCMHETVGALVDRAMKAEARAENAEAGMWAETAPGKLLLRAETAEAKAAEWRERAEYAEREMSEAFGLPPTIGPAPGWAAKIVNGLKAKVGELERQNESALKTFFDTMILCESRRDMAERALASEQHEFKNFHRLLCERFAYYHDERDWKRDQLSLIEWIDGRSKRGVWREAHEMARDGSCPTHS